MLPRSIFVVAGRQAGRSRGAGQLTQSLTHSLTPPLKPEKGLFPPVLLLPLLLLLLCGCAQVYRCAVDGRHCVLVHTAT